MNSTLNSITSSGGVNNMTPESVFSAPLTDSDGFDTLSLNERQQLEHFQNQKSFGARAVQGEDGAVRLQANTQTPAVARVIINEFNQRGGLTPDSYREFYFGLVQHYCNERQNGTKKDVEELLKASLPYDHIARTMYPELTDEEAQTKIADLNDQILNLGFDMFHPSGKLRDISNMVDNLHPTGTAPSKADVVDELIQASGVKMQRARSGFDEQDFTHEGSFKHAGLDDDGKELNESARELLDLVSNNPRLMNDFLIKNPQYKELIKDGEITEAKTFMLGEDGNSGFVQWYLYSDKSPHSEILKQETAAIQHYNKALIACEIFKMRAEKGEVDAAAEYALVRQLCDETQYSGYREKLRQHGWLQSQAEQELWDDCSELSRKLNARADESHALAKKLKGAEQEDKMQDELTKEQLESVRKKYASGSHLVGVVSSAKDSCALLRLSHTEFDQLCRARGKDPANASIVAVISSGGKTGSRTVVKIPVKRSKAISPSQHGYEPEMYVNYPALRSVLGKEPTNGDLSNTHKFSIDFHVE